MKQYEVVLSELVYAFAEKKKRGLPGWVVPTGAAAGVIGGGLLLHKKLGGPKAVEASKKPTKDLADDAEEWMENAHKYINEQAANKGTKTVLESKQNVRSNQSQIEKEFDDDFSKMTPEEFRKKWDDPEAMWRI